MNDTSVNIKAVLQILASTILWGIGYPFWKFLAIEFSPLTLTLITFTFAATVIFIMYRLSIRELIEKFKTHFILLMLLGLSGGVLGTGLIMYSLSLVDISIASFIEKLQPIFAIAAAKIFLNESLPKGKMPFILLALVCSYFLAVPEPLSPFYSDISYVGVFAAAGASLFYGLNTVICRYLVVDGISAAELTFFRMSIGACQLLPIVYLQGGLTSDLLQKPLNVWLILILASIISLVLAFDMFFRGLKFVSASIATMLELVTPVVAMGVGVYFLNEKVSLSQILAVPVFLFSIYYISSTKRTKKLNQMNQP